MNFLQSLLDYKKAAVLLIVNLNVAIKTYYSLFNAVKSGLTYEDSSFLS